MNLSEVINITLSMPHVNFSTNSSGFTFNQVVPENDFCQTFGVSATEGNSQFSNIEGETFHRKFYECIKTPSHFRKNISLSCMLSPTGDLLEKVTPSCEKLTEQPTPLKKTSPWRLIIQEGDVITSSPVFKKPKSAYDEDKDRSGFVNFLARVGWTTGIVPGQEYLDDLYEIARSRNDPMLLESLESFIAAIVEGLLQKQSDNEKLGTALKHATENNSAIALELEAEMKHQVAMVEEKIREEEQSKLEDQKQEAHVQMVSAQSDLKHMEQKVKDLEEQIEEKKNEANIPETLIEEMQTKEREHKILLMKLVEYQTQMALMRTEVAQMKAVYDEQAERLASEQGVVQTCVSEQENLTRQLYLLDKANKCLHDTNDDLCSALNTKRSNAEESSFLPWYLHMYNSFRSNPDVPHSPNGSCSNDTDKESKYSISYDEDTELAVDKSYAYHSPVSFMARSTANSTLIEPVSSISKETSLKQLEILCETNIRLGESNDQLKDALGLMSGHIRMNREMISSSNSAGCQSALINPMRSKPSNAKSPQSTSSPGKALLTKSGYQSSLLRMYSQHQPGWVVEEDGMDDMQLIQLVGQTNKDDLSQSITNDHTYNVMREPIENRGNAVGADASDDTSDSGTPDCMYKLVLAGNTSVGKSSFIIRLCRNKFYSALHSTLGVDIEMKTINCDGSKVALQLWDTAGQERYRSIAKSYFRRVDGVILLYDVTCEKSFLDVREWLECIESGSLKEIPMIICGNKTDLRNDATQNGLPVVSRQQGLKLAQDANALFIETSAKDGTNIHKACMELTRKLQKINDDQMAEVTINLEEKQKPKSRCCR